MAKVKTAEEGRWRSTLVSVLRKMPQLFHGTCAKGLRTAAQAKRSSFIVWPFSTTLAISLVRYFGH